MPIESSKSSPEEKENDDLESATTSSHKQQEEIPIIRELSKAFDSLSQTVSGFFCFFLEIISGFWEERLIQEPLPNFHQMNSTIFRGGQPTRDGFQKLEKKGIRMVINLRILDTDQRRIESTKLQYLHIPINPHYISHEQIVLFVQELARTRNHPVFVHCYHGSDRTGFFIAIARIIFDGLTKEEAMHEMLHGGYGFHHRWQENLIEILKNLDIDKIRRDALEFHSQ